MESWLELGRGMQKTMKREWDCNEMNAGGYRLRVGRGVEFDWRGIIVMNWNEFSWWVWGDGLDKDCLVLIRNEKEWWWLQLWDSNARRCKWYRSEAEWIGIENPRNSRFAWFLSHTQVIGGDQENKAESTDHFISQTNSSIDSTSQEVTIKQATHTLNRESILFSRSSVCSTTSSSFTSTMSKRLTHPFHTSFGP